MKKMYNREVALHQKSDDPIEEDNISIVIWPDDVWCFVEDLNEYIGDHGKSDDYVIREVHISLEYDDIDNYVMKLNRGEIDE